MSAKLTAHTHLVRSRAMSETETRTEKASLAMLPNDAGTEGSLAARVGGLPEEQVEVLRRTVCKELEDNELLLFLTRCRRKGLDPFDQVSVWKDRDGKVTMQVRIDGLRALSRRSGTFAGRELELLQNDKGEVYGARCTVFRSDIPRPFVEEALLKEYHKGAMWDRMPETMIRKVAESKALRAAFPEELAGWYEPAEMDQAVPEEDR